MVIILIEVIDNIFNVWVKNGAQDNSENKV